MIIRALCIIGFCISLYAYHVERAKKESDSYKALCDISDRVSCSKLLTGKYSSLFGVSNALLGMLFYSVLFVVTWLPYPQLIFYLTATSAIASVGLAYLSYFKAGIFCSVCTLIYAINVALVVISAVRYFK